MGNQVENLDPQEYKEEWFKAAILAGKEFQLPNISSTLLARLLSKSDFHAQSGTQCSGPNHSEAIVSSQENPNPPKAQDSSSTGNNAPTTDELQLYGSKKRPISSSDQSPDNLGTASTALPHESRYKRNCYKCFTCGATFSGSYALSGHMISHPKRRKIESLKKRYYSEFFFDTTETTLPFASAFRYSSPQNYLQAATSELEKLLI